MLEMLTGLCVLIPVSCDFCSQRAVTVSHFPFSSPRQPGVQEAGAAAPTGIPALVLRS